MAGTEGAQLGDGIFIPSPSATKFPSLMVMERRFRYHPSLDFKKKILHGGLLCHQFFAIFAPF